MAYASKYYDPAKAHEYYMKHRKLKGRKKRTSTAGLNEAGKIASSEVKEAINAEKKEYLDKQKEIMNAQIKALREQLKGLSKEERKARKEEFKQRIQALRDLYKDHKAKVKEYFEEKCAQEMDKIKADPGFAQVKKFRSKKKKKK